jgi:hypothetical protein
MKAVVRIAMAMFLVAGLSAGAWAQAAAQASLAPTAPITYTGTVTEIDYATRIVTTRGSVDGMLATFEVPASVPQATLQSVRVGDTVTITYQDSIALRRKPAGEPSVDSVDPASRLRTATVTVTAIDLASRAITFTGASGRVYTRHVIDPANVDALRTVAVGDRIDVSWYETMTIVRGAGAPMAAVGADSLRHRFTISALIGWDNQFSGKMIKAGAGTYNGNPIVFDETTFDEVYGRMGLFKAGIGYRLSPRSELTVNFVLSDSASEPVTVGRIGNANAPLSASFDDYSYWGFEVGQRFYFTRVRFTPFVGYYAGLNRFTEINGDFAAPATGTQPAVTINDGQFFDRAWAFSFGPTGGVLIGLGPFEVMAQVELRYMGGLSDVDPLSQAGLKDINSESSRWSFPILVGARIRF